jgi:NAD(P)-dependent dehydrogenase (short-subunit alcohol dehydrogenase family)
MLQSLSGKKVVIIGTSSGVDLAIAEQMLAVGAKVVLSHSSSEKLQQAIESIGGEMETKTVDVSNEDAVNTFFEQIGNFDHLVVTAMGDRNLPRSLLPEMSTATAQGAMAKFWGTFFAVRASLNTIATDGSITLTASVSTSNLQNWAGFPSSPPQMLPLPHLVDRWRWKLPRFGSTSLPLD